MKKVLINFCKDYNIEYVGVTDIGPFEDLKNILVTRENLNCGFEEKDLDKRIDPTLTMPNVKSIIVCLFPYYSHISDGNLSNYTYCKDYHLVVKSKLDEVGNYLKKRIDNFEFQSYVDTGPLVERYLAYKAGLGFYGINGHIINDKYGTYFFIGYILNNYPFEHDEPLDKTCYRCMKCVKACPGQVILGNYDINAKKCRSFLTQKKEELSNDEISIIQKDNIIFGCDICQRVCPHNNEITTTPLEEFEKNLIFNLTYEDINELSNKEFKKKYGDRAFSWRGKKLLLRNMDIIKNKDNIN